MKVLELFSGTGVISKTFREHGHGTFTIDFNKECGADWSADILEVTAQDIIDRFGVPDVIWASPDCTTYSLAAISHHRYPDKTAKTEYARVCDAVNAHMIELIKELNPKYYFIENPRAVLRKMSFMQELPRYTVTYCQYGHTAMKPTDIWTNHPNPQFKPMCKNGDPCHEAAPRGSKTGTQGFKCKYERGMIPQQLCEHIVQICGEQYAQ